jgi:hypothetical protein
MAFNEAMVASEKKASPSKEREMRIKHRAAFAVPRGTKKLFVVEVAVEVRSRKELDQVIEGISKVLCPWHPVGPHPDCCPRRWMTVSHPANSKERREWEPLLNE